MGDFSLVGWSRRTAASLLAQVGAGLDFLEGAALASVAPVVDRGSMSELRAGV